jgi:lipid-binding SYLF domain-containing protein
VKNLMSFRSFLIFIGGVALVGVTLPALGQERATLEANARRAYDRLVAEVPAAKAVAKRAVAALMFPRITRAGLMVGGQTGQGVLLKDGKMAGFYNTTGGSFGLQAGVQQFGYALFFMNEDALNALYSTNGFEVGVGPTVVVVDQGMARSLTSITMRDDVYAFIFSQRGLMAGVGMQGNKITRLNN